MEPPDAHHLASVRQLPSVDFISAVSLSHAKPVYRDFTHAVKDLEDDLSPSDLCLRLKPGNA